MNGRLFAVMTLVAGCTWLWAGDNKASLEQARSHYREAVTQHGANSPQAKRARRHLRSARQSFHTERRQRSKTIKN